MHADIPQAGCALERGREPVWVLLVANRRSGECGCGKHTKHDALRDVELRPHPTVQTGTSRASGRSDPGLPGLSRQDLTSNENGPARSLRTIPEFEALFSPRPPYMMYIHH